MRGGGKVNGLPSCAHNHTTHSDRTHTCDDAREGSAFIAEGTDEHDHDHMKTSRRPNTHVFMSIRVHPCPPGAVAAGRTPRYRTLTCSTWNFALKQVLGIRQILLIKMQVLACALCGRSVEVRVL